MTLPPVPWDELQRAAPAGLLLGGALAGLAFPRKRGGAAALALLAGAVAWAGGWALVQLWRPAPAAAASEWRSAGAASLAFVLAPWLAAGTLTLLARTPVEGGPGGAPAALAAGAGTMALGAAANADLALLGLALALLGMIGMPALEFAGRGRGAAAAARRAARQAAAALFAAGFAGMGFAAWSAGEFARGPGTSAAAACLAAACAACLGAPPFHRTAGCGAAAGLATQAALAAWGTVVGTLLALRTLPGHAAGLPLALTLGTAALAAAAGMALRAADARGVLASLGLANAGLAAAAAGAGQAPAALALAWTSAFGLAGAAAAWCSGAPAPGAAPAFRNAVARLAALALGAALAGMPLTALGWTKLWAAGAGALGEGWAGLRLAFAALAALATVVQGLAVARVWRGTPTAAPSRRWSDPVGVAMALFAALTATSVVAIGACPGPVARWLLERFPAS